MSARGFLAIFIAYILIAFSVLLYHFSVDPDGASAYMLLHLFNVGIGINGIWQSIDAGLRFGWKS